MWAESGSAKTVHLLQGEQGTESKLQILFVHIQ